jgi:hypothetical protein
MEPVGLSRAVAVCGFEGVMIVLLASFLTPEDEQPGKAAREG